MNPRRRGLSPIPRSSHTCEDRPVSSRVLIVDDHAPFRALARELLGVEGFEVVGEAADGLSALDQARRLRPTLVLLDVQLPDGDGFEVARLLAENTDPPTVILISSRDITSYRHRLAGSPARGFITKAELSAAAVAELIG
jgi:DNA-binding NarL/FixJ family response regulator